MTEISTIKFQRRIITEAMDKVLTDREKRIFVAQILAGDKEEQMTLDELGAEFGVSKERVRQLRISASRKVEAEVIRIAENDDLDPRDMFLG